METTGTRSMKDLLRSIVPSSGKSPQRLTVSRDHLFNDSIAFFKKRDFDVLSPVRVVFEGEPVVDGGGPRREYFSLLLHCIVSPSSPCRLFEGRSSFILPMHNVDAIRAGLFKVAGRMIMASIVNGGPGFPHFPSILYDYLISSAGETEQLLSTITKDDVVDFTVLEAIQKVYTFLTACRQCSIIILCILCNNTHGEVSCVIYILL